MTLLSVNYSHRIIILLSLLVETANQMMVTKILKFILYSIYILSTKCINLLRDTQ